MLRGIRNFLNGVVFGITEIVPGVSAGTIAIILGFYDELIGSVNNFTKDYRKSLKFLLPLFLGITVGVLIFSSIINYLLAYYSLPTMAFFVGLISGIIPIIYKKVKDPERRFNIKEIALITVPVIILAVISNLEISAVSRIANPAEVIDGIGISFMIFIFFAGIIAAAALIIPGVSGSFVLLLLGVYPLVTYSVSSVRLWLIDITNIALLLNICRVLLPLGVGIIIGGLSMARFIGKLLNNYHKTLYSIILGLLVGSVYAIFNEPIVVFRSGVNAAAIIIAVITFCGGSVISFTLGKKRF